MLVTLHRQFTISIEQDNRVGGTKYNDVMYSVNIHLHNFVEVWTC